MDVRWFAQTNMHHIHSISQVPESEDLYFCGDKFGNESNSEVVVSILSEAVVKWYVNTFETKAYQRNQCIGVTFDGDKQQVAVLMQTDALNENKNLDLITLFLSTNGTYESGFRIT